jgi:hypothetical protein
MEEMERVIAKRLRQGGWGISFSAPDIANVILAAIQETHVVVEKDRFARMRGVLLGIQDVQDMQQAQGEDVDAEVRAVMLRGLQSGDLERLL